ncbi:MAG: prolipoprotein diacylglyceryl transferase [Ruminococcaceae bacterium]|nr:prolipoprotein diacylglyceryl transferase [Oscillospiraceae bacterium]MBQ3214503.1 prolipoprotein diacylglyceryl transferase [Oscillospiraceae bacterium]
MHDFSPISFPSFGININPNPEIHIGTLSIRWYGVLIAIGLLLAVVYACRRSKQFGLRDDDIIDGVLCIAPFAIICARLYYCIFEWDQYKDNLVGILKIWEGGLAIYGGVIGAVIGIIVFSMVKKDKVHLFALLDITSIGFLIGQCIGRWGNFMNREAFGSATDSFFRMGLYQKVTEDGSIVHSATMNYFHPTFLYESVWNLCGFVLLHFLSKKRKYDGQIALGYVAWYGLGRAFIEGLRTDSLWWGPFRVSQVLAAGSCILAVGALIFFQIRKPDEQKLFVRQVAAREAAAQEAETADEETAE